jgi:hypothetical protein
VITALERPEPFGFSWPLQTALRANKMVSPGWKAVELTLSSDPQAALADVPLFASLPAPQFT